MLTMSNPSLRTTNYFAKGRGQSHVIFFKFWGHRPVLHPRKGLNYERDERVHTVGQKAEKRKFDPISKFAGSCTHAPWPMRAKFGGRSIPTVYYFSPNFVMIVIYIVTPARRKTAAIAQYLTNF